MPRLTGERPLEGRTPDSILAIHAAGYRAVRERLGEGRVLDLGCGVGFESARLLAERRNVVGVDYQADALSEAGRRHGDAGLQLACMRAEQLGLKTGALDWVSSSHLIEHFADPSVHVAEAARVLADEGSAFFLTPNEPADFENPFHVHLFGPEELSALLAEHFLEVELWGLEASARASADLAARRMRAQRILALDVLGLRRRLPRSWYQRAYATLLPLAYRLVARSDVGGASGISEEDFFLTQEISEATPVLLAVARAPRRGAAATPDQRRR
jgi:SAM-dependent methyltransferase